MKSHSNIRRNIHYTAGTSDRRNVRRHPGRRLQESISSEDWYLDYEDAVYQEAEDVKKAVQGRIDDYRGPAKGMHLGPVIIDDPGLPAESWSSGGFEPAEISMELYVPEDAEPSLLRDYGYDDVNVSVDDVASALEEHFQDYFDMWASGIVGIYWDTSAAGGDRYTVTYHLGETDFTIESWYEANADDDMYESRRRPMRKPAVHARPRSRRAPMRRR